MSRLAPLALIAGTLAACSLPPVQPLTPEQQRQQEEFYRLSAAVGAHSNDGGSFAAILGRAMQDVQGSGAAQPAQKLMVFGGPGHNTYLGCLSCNSMAPDSILNAYGNFGSAYSSTSIRNSYSEYGSSYSRYSACSPYAMDPPVIVDDAGNFYGRLTINAMNPQRPNNQNLQNWLAAACNH